MREALIILPKADNHGRKIDYAASVLASDLVVSFGGCTLRDAKGYWQSADKLHVEDVMEYVVACDDTSENERALTTIALRAGTNARQEAVYVRYPSGNVDILTIPPVVEPAKAA